MQLLQEYKQLDVGCAEPPPTDPTAETSSSPGCKAHSNVGLTVDLARFHQIGPQNDFLLRLLHVLLTDVVAIV